MSAAMIRAYGSYTTNLKYNFKCLLLRDTILRSFAWFSKLGFAIILDPIRFLMSKFKDPRDIRLILITVLSFLVTFPLSLPFFALSLVLPVLFAIISPIPVFIKTTIGFAIRKIFGNQERDEFEKILDNPPVETYEEALAHGPLSKDNPNCLRPIIWRLQKLKEIIQNGKIAYSLTTPGFFQCFLSNRLSGDKIGITEFNEKDISRVPDKVDGVSYLVFGFGNRVISCEKITLNQLKTLHKIASFSDDLFGGIMRRSSNKPPYIYLSYLCFRDLFRSKSYFRSQFKAYLETRIKFLEDLSQSVPTNILPGCIQDEVFACAIPGYQRMFQPSPSVGNATDALSNRHAIP